MENVKALKERLGWQKTDKSFNIPDAVYRHYEDISRATAADEAAWNELFDAYRALRFPRHDGAGTAITRPWMRRHLWKMRTFGYMERSRRQRVPSRGMMLN